MKKYVIKVEQVREYELEIDETKFTEKDIKVFESLMYPIDKVLDADGKVNRYASLAHEIVSNRILDAGYEGLGFPKEYGHQFHMYGNNAFNFTKIDEEDFDIVVEEVEE